jgi:hypothetical protein
LRQRRADVLAATHDKAFLTVEPVNAVDPRGLALLTLQNEQSPDPKRFRSLARSRSWARSSMSGGRHDR